MESKKIICWILRLLMLLRVCISTFFDVMVLILEQGTVQQKQIEARAHILAQQEARYRMNEFLSVASHELKTPLTSIKGNIQLLMRYFKQGMAKDGTCPYGPEHAFMKMPALLERTDQQLNRLTRVVNTLLDSARIQANTLDLFLEVCDVCALVKEIVQERHHHLSPSRVLYVDMPTDRPALVMGDAHRIKQVIVHYLTNAHKFSSVDSPITLQVREEEQVVRVLVYDKGPGIALEEQKSIWDCFYRVPDIPVVNGTEIGLGLGLYVSKMIIEQHHGQVGVQSMPGAGSIFWFTLPIAQYKL
jgi:signal transduction histidine kinase